MAYSSVETRLSPVTYLPEREHQKLWADQEYLSPGGGYPLRQQPMDQLSWAQPGGLRVRAAQAQWRVASNQLVWIPAYCDHEMWEDGANTVLSLHIDPTMRPAGTRWQRPLLLSAIPLLRAIMHDVCAPHCAPGRLEHAYPLIADLLASVSESSDALALPQHPAAGRVAQALIADPAGARTIEMWAGDLGVSAKTLQRGFVTGTGLTFAQWRTRARMHHAAALLAQGRSVQDVAGEVGYSTSTGFIKAYRSVYRVTPRAHNSRFLPAAHTATGGPLAISPGWPA